MIADRSWIWGKYFWTWFLLLAFLAATAVMAFVPMGWLNIIVSLIIGFLKAVTIALIFMHMRLAKGAVRLAGLAGLLLLSTLFLLTFADYLTRPLW